MPSLEQNPVTIDWWRKVVELFITFNARPRHEWHRGLIEACPNDAALAYEVLSLLVAAESVGVGSG